MKVRKNLYYERNEKNNVDIERKTLSKKQEIHTKKKNYEGKK